MEPIITFKALTFAFSNESEPLFDRVTFSIAPGSLTLVQGGNGCGKSTLMRLLLDRALPGQQVSGNVVRNGMVRLVAQRYDDMLAPSLTVSQNLACAQLGRVPGLHGLSVGMVPDILNNFAIPSDVPVGRLSGGQRQMLAIALCLQQPTDVLLLDEPTASLDEDNARHFLTFVRYLVDAGLGVVLICHQSEHLDACVPNQVIEIIRVPRVYTRQVRVKQYSEPARDTSRPQP